MKLQETLHEHGPLHDVVRVTSGEVVFYLRNRLKGLPKLDFAWWGIVILGIILRLRQYLVNRSFWADEASLAVNLANRTYGQLLGLLDYQQAAPVGFLYIEKTLITLFGNHDYVLRLFPLFAGILSTYLIYRIAREHLGTAGLFAVLLFVISWGLVYYSSELKQYSSDVMAAVLLIFLAENCLRVDARAKDFLLLGIVGSLVIWISHPSVFILAGIGVVLVNEKIFRARFVPLPWIFGLGIGWATSFGLEYLVSLRNIVTDGFLIDYWRKAYMPLPPWSDPGWFVKVYQSFLNTGLHTHWSMSLTFIVLVLVGSLSLLMRQRSLAMMLILPVPVTLIFSALQRYPFMHRFLLFLLPLALLLMAEGIRFIYYVISRWSRTLAFAAIVFPVSVSLWLLVPVTSWFFVHPAMGADIKPVMQYIGENRRPRDTIYVYYGSAPAFVYYAPFYGLDRANVTIGFETLNRRLALRRFYEDVDTLRGNKRVWFIFSDIIDCGGCGENTQQYFVDYLNGFGTLLDSAHAAGANGYLYRMKP
jgi:hypothetical protein